ncbi:MAG: hypothetical protein P4L91_18930, partial [Burkholderiaceae bacterium]|nr:hypothetical protein [Burkholderiaceae bacterium]
TMFIYNFAAFLGGFLAYVARVRAGAAMHHSHAGEPPAAPAPAPVESEQAYAKTTKIESTTAFDKTVKTNVDGQLASDGSVPNPPSE